MRNPTTSRVIKINPYFYCLTENAGKLLEPHHQKPKPLLSRNIVAPRCKYVRRKMAKSCFYGDELLLCGVVGVLVFLLLPLNTILPRVRRICLLKMDTPPHDRPDSPVADLIKRRRNMPTYIISKVSRLFSWSNPDGQTEANKSRRKLICI